MPDQNNNQRPTTFLEQYYQPPAVYDNVYTHIDSYLTPTQSWSLFGEIPDSAPPMQEQPKEEIGHVSPETVKDLTGERLFKILDEAHEKSRQAG